MTAKQFSTGSTAQSVQRFGWTRSHALIFGRAKRHFSLPKYPDRINSSIRLPFVGYPGYFLEGQSGLRVKLTTYIRMATKFGNVCSHISLLQCVIQPSGFAKHQCNFTFQADAPRLGVNVENSHHLWYPKILYSFRNSGL